MQLEAAGRELQRMPALSDSASAPQPHDPLSLRGKCSARRGLHWRLDGVSRGRGDDERGWKKTARVPAGIAGRKPRTRALLHGISQLVPEFASGLRDDAYALAAGGGPDARDMRIALPSR